MMDRMTEHERCSEALAGYLRGDLSQTETAWVEAHLAACDECSQELVALRALEGPEAPALTELERARLRRVVLTEAVPLPDARARGQAPSRGARLYRYLGAAALLAAIGGFVYMGLNGTVGGDEAATGPTAEVEADAGSEPEGAGGGDGAQSGFRRDQTVDEESDAGPVSRTAKDTLAGVANAAPQPTFKEWWGNVDQRRLNKLAREGLPLVVFSRAFNATEAPELRDEFLQQMAKVAPGARARQLVECTDVVAGQFPTVVPAFAAVGNLTEGPDREILLVAYAWTEESQGPLDKSMVWAWPLSDCSSIAHYSTNEIEPRP